MGKTFDKIIIFIVVMQQNIAISLFIYPIFKVASGGSKFPKIWDNFEKHIFNWLIFIWSHDSKKIYI